jgi:alginate O-acetyltransferase complex protein AlgI
MIYNSSIFLLYFLPVFLLVYFLIPVRFRNWFIMLSGILFYAWGAPLFVFILAGSVLVDFFLVKGIAHHENPKKKWFLAGSILLNLGLLLYFKYMNFFVEQFDEILKILNVRAGSWTKIAIPVGISFITFQKLAYVLDVYKKHHSPFRKIQDYALYIFMFPQLLSGPIVRPGQISGQITDRHENETIDNRLLGFYRFMIGLAKKVLIADVLAVSVNEIFALNSFQLSTGLAWIGALAYTFQIYFDFSGYTDMALGLARMMGFKLPENFNNPYISRSITEFWRRWHITLSFWFRDYVFLPLAYSVSRKLPRERYSGIRTDKVIYVIAVGITFLLCGFWHGAAWTFILWGLYQGIFLALDRFFLLKYLKKTGKLVPVLITFVIIVFGWVLFRSESLDYYHFYLRKMFLFQPGNNEIWLTPKFWIMGSVAIIFSFLALIPGIEKWQEKLYDHPGNSLLIGFSVIAVFLFILSESVITSNGFSPFIYFRF